MASAEAFAFKEGSLYLWTGSHTASGSPIAYVDSVGFSPNWQWQSDPSLSGTYRDHLMGIQSRLSMNVVYTLDQRVMQIAQMATAVHLKLLSNNSQGSAGYLVHSAHIDGLYLQGSEGGVLKYSLDVHAHIWSAF